MLREQIKQEIDKQISMIIDNEITTQETDFIDYRGVGLNSVQLLILMIKLEEYFGFEFDDEQFILNRFQHISDIIDLVESALDS